MSASRRAFLAQAAGAAAGLSLGALVPRAAGALAVTPPRAEPGDWARLREEFLLPREHAYFNAGTLGPTPRVVHEAVVRHMTHVEHDLAHWDYDPAHEQFYAGYYPELALRERIGQVIGAAADEIALTTNATEAMNLVAGGLSLGVGDEVVLAEGAHVGSRSGWALRAKRHGAHVKTATLPAAVVEPAQLVDAYERATTPQTRVWAIEHLTSPTAIRFPVEELCRRARARGILTVIDGAQTVGHLAVDVRAIGCDAYYTSAHKWLLAPVGTGFLFARRDVLSRVWTTVASEFWDDHARGAFRLMQRGTQSRSPLEGFARALDFHLALGSARVEARNVALATRLREGLATVRAARVVTPSHPEMRSGTVTWALAGFPGRQLQDALWSRARVRVRAQGDAVRQCCHVYCLEEEVDRTVEAAERF